MGPKILLLLKIESNVWENAGIAFGFGKADRKMTDFRASRNFAYKRKTYLMTCINSLFSLLNLLIHLNSLGYFGSLLNLNCPSFSAPSEFKGRRVRVLYATLYYALARILFLRPSVVVLVSVKPYQIYKPFCIFSPFPFQAFRLVFELTTN